MLFLALATALCEVQYLDWWLRGLPWPFVIIKGCCPDVWPSMLVHSADTKGEDGIGKGHGQQLRRGGNSVLINLYGIWPGLSEVSCIHGNHADRVQSRGLPGQYHWHCHGNWHDAHPSVTGSALLTVVWCDRCTWSLSPPYPSVHIHTNKYTHAWQSNTTCLLAISLLWFLTLYCTCKHSSHYIKSVHDLLLSSGLKKTIRPQKN